MESGFGDQESRDAARAALDAIGDDRDRIGQRMTAETWWAAPAQGAGAALLVLAALCVFWYDRRYAAEVHHAG